MRTKDSQSSGAVVGCCRRVLSSGAVVGCCRRVLSSGAVDGPDQKRNRAPISGGKEFLIYFVPCFTAVQPREDGVYNNNLLALFGNHPCGPSR